MTTPEELYKQYAERQKEHYARREAQRLAQREAKRQQDANQPTPEELEAQRLAQREAEHTNTRNAINAALQKGAARNREQALLMYTADIRNPQTRRELIEAIEATREAFLEE